MESGVRLDLGSTLWQIFLNAGLGLPLLQTHVRVEAAPAAETSRYLADTTRALLPPDAGAGARHEGPDLTLEERLMRELSARRSTTISPMVIGAWARKPDETEKL